MEVHLTPDVQARIERLVIETGRTASELLDEALFGYEIELAEMKKTLNSRYDDMKSGKVKGIPGEEFFANLRKRQDERLKNK